MANVFDQAEVAYKAETANVSTGNVFDQAEAEYNAHPDTNVQSIQKDTTGGTRGKWETPIYDPTGEASNFVTGVSPEAIQAAIDKGQTRTEKAKDISVNKQPISGVAGDVSNIPEAANFQIGVDPNNIKPNDFLTRVLPESLVRTVFGVAGMPAAILKGEVDAYNKGVGHTEWMPEEIDPMGNIIPAGERNIVPESGLVKGFSEFMGKPLGLYGKDEFINAWSTDPVGSALAILPFTKLKGGAAKAFVDDTVKAAEKEFKPTAQRIAEEIAPVSDVSIAENVKKIQGVMNVSKRLDLPPEFVWENYDTIMSELEKQGVAPKVEEVKVSGKEEKAGVQVAETPGEGPSLHEAAPKASVNPNDVSLDKLKTTLKSEEGVPGITVEKGYYPDMPEGDPNLIKIVSRNEKGEVNGILDIPIIMGEASFPTIATNQKGIARELVKKAEELGHDVTTMDNVYTPEGADFMKKVVENKAGEKKAEVVSKNNAASPEQMSLLGQEGAIRVPKIINETAEAIDKIKENIGKPQGSGAKAGIGAMAEHHRAVRDIDYIYGPKGPIQEVATLFDKSVPSERQQLVINAIQQPTKYLSELTTQEREFVDLYNKESVKVTQYAKDAGVLKDDNPNYLYQWWIDKKTGEAFNTHYGQYSKSAPQFKQRKYQSYEEGINAGEMPASTNPFTLLQKSASAVNKAVEARILFQNLASIEKYSLGEKALDKMGLSDEPTTMLRSERSTESKPLRIVESWERLKDQGLEGDYVRYSHDALDKSLTFKDADGNIHTLKGDVGITKELFPYVKAYLESPTYGNLSKINFASKSMKLMSGFHIVSLSWQGVAGGLGKGRVPLLNVIDGLKKIEGGSETLRILYRNGLQLHGYADIGPAKTGLFDMLENNKYTKYFGKVLSATQKLTFEVVHPGIKANTAFTIFEDLVNKAETKKGDTLSIIEKDNLAKETVHYTDRLFSGEDYKTALLQTNKWMAEYFYSPEARKRWQFALISPQWQKAHIGIVIDVAKSFATKEGRAAPTAELYRKYLYSALIIYAAANLYNFVMTEYMDNDGKLMVQNDGHNSFSVRAPYNDLDGKKVYFRPLKSIFEVPEYLSDVVGKSISKMAPWVATAAEQIKPMQYDKYKGYENIPKRAGNIMQGMFMPMAEPTIMDESKNPASKALSIIGIPTSKGYPEWVKTTEDQALYEEKKKRKEVPDEVKEIRKLKKQYKRERMQ
jgi:hypothetical protein